MNEHLSNAARIAPILVRVHGANHPELARVNELTQQLNGSENNSERAELFEELRTVTGDFAIPSDACEAYQSVYQSLEAASNQFAQG